MEVRRGTMCSGLKHHYAYQMAVNPNDPENIIIATSSNPHVAHDYNNGNCESFIYKKKKISLGQK